ncbi:8162_t:CDS:2, partial [Ambispora leptoticha]
EMWDQEKHHLSTFDEIISRYRVRPAFLRPIWEATGFLLGAGTAFELIKLKNSEEISELSQIIQKFCDDELHHLDTAVDHDAQKAPLHGPLTVIINNGCKVAI